MMFDNKSLNEISDEAILSLVADHIVENQHLEYKLTVNLKDDSDKHEVLKDIASLANGGGGYLIIGIRDDGHGRAMRFEPQMVGDTNKILISVKDLCLDHIQERIHDIEFQERVVDENPIVLVRVPVSNRIPHMISYQRHTDFWGRVDDGKRELKYAEIRELFQGDIIARRLNSIERSVGLIERNIIAGEDRDRIINTALTGSTLELLRETDGKYLIEAYAKRFQFKYGEKSYFCIQAIPHLTSSSFLDVEDIKTVHLINNPPGHRYGGWDMSFEHQDIRNTAFGMLRGREDFRLIELWTNGFLELIAEIDANFCWGQSEEEFRTNPKFNPITISEYIVSYVRFYSALMKLWNYQDKSYINLSLLNIKGFSIRQLEWHPRSANRFDEQNFILPGYELNDYDNTDLTSFDLVRTLFRSFGYSEKDIPAWDKRSKTFQFDQLSG